MKINYSILHSNFKGIDLKVEHYLRKFSEKNNPDFLEIVNNLNKCYQCKLPSPTRFELLSNSKKIKFWERKKMLYQKFLESKKFLENKIRLNSKIKLLKVKLDGAAVFNFNKISDRFQNLELESKNNFSMSLFSELKAIEDLFFWGQKIKRLIEVIGKYRTSLGSKLRSNCIINQHYFHRELYKIEKFLIPTNDVNQLQLIYYQVNNQLKNYKSIFSINQGISILKEKTTDIRTELLKGYRKVLTVYNKAKSNYSYATRKYLDGVDFTRKYFENTFFTPIMKLISLSYRAILNKKFQQAQLLRVKCGVIKSNFFKLLTMLENFMDRLENSLIFINNHRLELSTSGDLYKKCYLGVNLHGVSDRTRIEWRQLMGKVSAYNQGLNHIVDPIVIASKGKDLYKKIQSIYKSIELESSLNSRARSTSLVELLK